MRILKFSSFTNLNLLLKCFFLVIIFNPITGFPFNNNIPIENNAHQQQRASIVIKQILHKRLGCKSSTFKYEQHHRQLYNQQNTITSETKNNSNYINTNNNHPLNKTSSLLPNLQNSVMDLNMKFSEFYSYIAPLTTDCIHTSICELELVFDQKQLTLENLHQIRLNNMNISYEMNFSPIRAGNVFHTYEDNDGARHSIVHYDSNRDNYEEKGEEQKKENTAKWDDVKIGVDSVGLDLNRGSTTFIMFSIQPELVMFLNPNQSDKEIFNLTTTCKRDTINNVTSFDLNNTKKINTSLAAKDNLNRCWIKVFEKKSQDVRSTEPVTIFKEFENMAFHDINLLVSNIDTQMGRKNQIHSVQKFLDSFKLGLKVESNNCQNTRDELFLQIHDLEIELF